MTKYQNVIDYIEEYWGKSTAAPNKSVWSNPRNLAMHLGRIKLPKRTVSPNHEYFAGTQFYWDTYFTIIGLVDAGRLDLAKGMVDNLVYLFKKFKLIPARNSWTSIGRTQPPYLTRMAFEVYEAGGADRKWLDRVMRIAQKEYEKVWLSGQRYDDITGLSRFRPKYLKRLLTVYESGWDVSTRFNYGEQEIIPVDLNCQLYQYEADFLKWAKLNQDTQAAKRWRSALKLRKEQIDNCFWDAKTGFYYDNHEGKVGTLKTLAGFYPLWCGVASKAQAKRCITKLKVFEFSGGLANSEKLPPSLRQWDYPNGWAPQQFIVIQGLLNYGYKKEADRIGRKWLDCNTEIFERTGKLWEKYNVVDKKVGRRGRYPTQPGFAWTNSVFLRLQKMLGLDVLHMTTNNDDEQDKIIRVIPR
jgi:alpha,alpha-trehalase